MNKISVLAAGVSAAMVAAAAYSATAAPPPPVATYWMDVATTSGMGAGMAGGGRPNLSQVMGMMNGGSGVMHTLDLRLASKTKAPAAAQADHWIPAGLQMGASLPLLAPVKEESPGITESYPTTFQKPKGRMLIYWGCGEHVSAGQPTVIDFSKIAPGQMPPGMAAMASVAHSVAGPQNAPGFGRWPNQRDSRPVPASGSLVGAHKVDANYAPQINFSLAAGQDFMPGLGFREAGSLSSGATRMVWQQAPTATGYALVMFAGSGNGDVVMWSSAKSAGMPSLDYLAPAEVKRLIAAGTVLAPSVSECALPAEVAAAAPQGMVTMIGYGPEANFTGDPKAPKWATKVRYKTTASLIRGMGAMMGGPDDSGDESVQQQQQQQAPQKKKRGFGLGDLIGAIPH